MSRDPLVSVCISVYNGEKFLNRCIDNILKQTYTNLEIVIVNDGSTDKTRELAENYAMTDKRVKVVNKQNEGLNYARRDGIANASGEFIISHDVDDLMKSEYIEKMVNAQRKGDYDVVECGTIFVYSNGSEERHEQKPLTDALIETHDATAIRSAIYGDNFAKIPWSTVCHEHLYRKSLFDGIDWTLSNEKIEDILTNYNIGWRIRSVAVIPDCLTYYTQQPDSLTHNVKFEDPEDLLRIRHRVSSLINEKIVDHALLQQYLTKDLVLALWTFFFEVDKRASKSYLKRRKTAISEAVSSFCQQFGPIESAYLKRMILVARLPFYLIYVFRGCRRILTQKVSDFGRL
jgi:glycosyltransferase involved in cell wall biosynthesis